MRRFFSLSLLLLCSVHGLATTAAIDATDPRTCKAGEVRLTFVTNACVLIELGSFKILTDPFFENSLGFDQEPGMKVQDLPKLDVIIGSHFAYDHFAIGSLRDYPGRADLAVFTATEGLAQKAQKHGFARAQQLRWGEQREIVPGLFLQALKAHETWGKSSNNYLLSDGTTSVFFGGETKDLDPLREWRSQSNSTQVDVVMAPSNGMRLLGVGQLVTNATEGLEAAKILGAKVFCPIHDSHTPLWWLGGPTSHRDDLKGLSSEEDTDDQPKIVFLKAGEATRVL